MAAPAFVPHSSANRGLRSAHRPTKLLLGSRPVPKWMNFQKHFVGGAKRLFLTAIGTFILALVKISNFQDSVKKTQKSLPSKRCSFLSMVSAMMGSQGVPALENFLAKVAGEGGQPEEKYGASKFVYLYAQISPGRKVTLSMVLCRSFVPGIEEICLG